MDRDLYAEASVILDRLQRRIVHCEHGDRTEFCRLELEAEVASLLRRIIIEVDREREKHEGVRRSLGRR